MPKVVKQRARPKRRKVVRRRKSRIAVDRIAPVSQVNEGFKFLLYGQTKNGKTRLACTFPKPLLLIGAAGFGTEKGTRSVSNVKGVDFVGLDSSEEVEQLCQLERYKTYVLDTAGGLQERVVNEFTDHTPTARKDWRHVNKGDWGPINGKTIERLRCLLDQSDFLGKHVVIIAHERAFNVEAESADLLFPFVGAALTPGVAGWLDGAVDYIGQCFKRQKTKGIPLSRKKKPTQIKTSGVDYCLRVGDHPVFKTGFRVPVGTKLPDVIVDPSFEKINKLIEQGG